MMDRALLLPALAALIVMLSCAQAFADEPYWPPAKSWGTASPAAVGMDPAKLEAALQFAGEHDSNGVVVLRGGFIVAERYWDGWDRSTVRDMYSAQKSVTATLVGIAIEQGLIKGLDQTAADFLVEWKGTAKAKITVGQLLAMTSGLHSSKRSDLFGHMRADDKTAYALALDQDHCPGKHWAYNNPGYGLVIEILERAWGLSRQELAAKNLFGPLGMKSSRCGMFDVSKLFKGNHHGIETTCRDMARFGLLVLRRGRWKDRQLVSERFLAGAQKPSGPNSAYGLFFWLNGGAGYRLPYDDDQHEGMLFPSCPPDTVAALGAKDSKIYVVRSLDLVVTRLGDSATRGGRVAPSEFDDPFLAGICNAVTKSGRK